MLREIKFRTWDHTEKEMNYVKKTEYLGGTGIIDQSENNPDNEWMQYTGLKDRKGKEIYEEDIWKEGVSTGVIVYEKDGFEIKWLENIDFWSETLKYHADQGEVVGNTFEHPHLLKGEEA